MIAANYLKHPFSLVRQCEMELVAVDVNEPQHRAFRQWLLTNAAALVKIVPAVPQWVKKARAAAKRLAKAVRLALMGISDGSI